MPYIHKKKYIDKTLTSQKVTAYHIVPRVLYLSADFSVAVSRQIDKHKLSFVNLKVIEKTRFPGSRRSLCNTLIIDDKINERRFTDVGFACDCNLRHTVIGYIFRICDGSHKSALLYLHNSSFVKSALF